jgi:hypothetical protein
VSTDLETRLRSLSDRLPLPEPSVTDRVVAAVTENMRTALPPAATHRRRPVARRWRGRIVAAAVGGVAVVGAMLVGSLTGDGTNIDPAAAAALHQAAIAAAHQPALPPLKAGQYYHFRDTEMGWVEKASAPNSFTSCSTSCPPPPQDWVVKVRVVSESWIAADGSGLRTETIGRPTFRSAAVRKSYQSIYGFPVSHPLGIPTSDRFPKGQRTFGWGLTYRQLRRLPSNPAKLLEIVRRQAAPSSQATDPSSSNPLNYEEFVVVGDMMRDSPLQPRVRAAFYTILSQLPGVQLVGHVTDPLGRPGLEVSMRRSPGEPRDILIFDPHNAQLLSEGDGGYSQWGIVNSLGG